MILSSLGVPNDWSSNDIKDHASIQLMHQLATSMISVNKKVIITGLFPYGSGMFSDIASFAGSITVILGTLTNSAAMANCRRS